MEKSFGRSASGPAALLFVLLVILPLAGCSWLQDLLGIGNDHEGTTPPVPGVIEVSPAGGTLNLADPASGAILMSLAIPPGAVTEITQVSVTAVASSDPSLGPILKLEPAGMSFAKPLTITVDCSAVLAATGLSLAELGLYCIADDLSIYPLLGGLADPAASTLSVKLLHFSGVAAAPKALSKDKVQALAAAAGAAYGQAGAASPPLSSEIGEGIKAAFEARFDNPTSEDSFQNACADLYTWCCDRAELQPGASWLVGVMGATGRVDMVGGGFRLTIQSYAGSYAVGEAVPAEDKTFFKDAFGPQGEYEANQLFCGAEWSEEVTVPIAGGGTRELIVIVYVTVEYMASPAHLEFVLPEAAAEPLPVAAGESLDLTARLWMKYLPIGAEAFEEVALPNELVNFTLEGPGSLGAAQALTDAEGKVSVSYSPAWASSEPNGETAAVKAARELVQGELGDSVSLVEIPSLVQATSPFEGQTLVERDASIDIRFSEPMDTSTVSISIYPEVAGTVCWTEGSVLWSVVLGQLKRLEPNTQYTVTVAAGAKATTGRDLKTEYVFSFTTKSVFIDMNIYAPSKFYIMAALADFPYDGTSVYSVTEAADMLFYMGASSVDCGFDYAVADFRNGYSIAVWANSYDKACYGLRYGIVGRSYFGSNETYFEIE